MCVSVLTGFGGIDCSFRATRPWVAFVVPFIDQYGYVVFEDTLLGVVSKGPCASSRSTHAILNIWANDHQPEVFGQWHTCTFSLAQIRFARKNPLGPGANKSQKPGIQNMATATAICAERSDPLA